MQNNLQVVSGGTWIANPIAGRVTLEIRLGGTRYVSKSSFGPAQSALPPRAVSLFTRNRETGAWKFAGRCNLGPALARCLIDPVLTEALRLEFDTGRRTQQVAVGPVNIDSRRIQ